ncbi:MAG TPA: dihydrofolate reductase family protein [Actinomycetes bacterium]
MGKVLWHITMSLDGFIAGPGDDMAWLVDYLGPNPTADQVLAQIGALLIGNRTYQLAKTQEGRPYGGAWTGPMLVLTHDAPETAAAGFTFVSGDIKQAVAAAKAAAGDKYVVILGATTAQECLDAGLLDEVLVHIAPVLLGDGVRLFDRPGGTNVKLERIGLTHSPLVTNLWLRVVK